MRLLRCSEGPSGFSVTKRPKRALQIPLSILQIIYLAPLTLLNSVVMARDRMDRRRAEPHEKPRKRQKTKDAKPQLPTKSFFTVSVSALPWTEVPLPDRLDDAEGFFGLEEISDVEIVKNGELGRVEYRVGKEAIPVYFSKP